MEKLLVICHGLPPYYGGAEHAAWALAVAAACEGYRVEALTSDLGGRLEAGEEREGIRVHRIPARKKCWTRHTAGELWSFYRSGLRHTEAVAQAFRPDAVLAHFSFPAGALAARIKRRLGIPYTVVLHGSDVPGYQPERFGLVYPVYRHWVRRIWREADAVVAVSEPLKQLALRAWPSGNIVVIPNGVDTDVFHPEPSGRVAREGFHITVVSQLIRRKGLDVLLEALAGLADNRGIQVDFCGVGPEERALKEQAARLGLGGQVRFRGLVSQEDLAGLLRAADAFVLPSLQEGLPLALLEAMASGLPVVASRTGDIAAVVRDGENGLLVPPGEAVALRAALQRLAFEPGLARELGRRARETAETLSWPRVWPRYAARMAPRMATSSGAGS